MLNYLPISLLLAGLIVGLCQLFKFIVRGIKQKSFSLNTISVNGGMPSSHSAFVSTLAVSIGIFSGFNSDVFAVSVMMASIVIHDSFKVRGTLERIAFKMNRITERYAPDLAADIPEDLGHTPGETVVGLVIGALFGAGGSLLFRYILMNTGS
jgi:hypothetical protein